MWRALLVTLLLAGAVTCSAAAETKSRRTVSGTQFEQIRAQVQRMQAKLDAEQEARDRQADAFDAATQQVEVVNAALAVVLALGGIGATVLGLRWVRSYTEQRVAARIDETIRDAGTELFTKEAARLTSEYDEKFAAAYSKYHGLVERDG